jgi:hypothetical protein
MVGIAVGIAEIESLASIRRATCVCRTMTFWEGDMCASSNARTHMGGWLAIPLQPCSRS